MSTRLRDLPSVDRVLSDERIVRLIARYSRRAVTDLVRAEMAACREVIGIGGPVPALAEIAAAIERRTSDRWREWPGGVIKTMSYWNSSWNSMVGSSAGGGAQKARSTSPDLTRRRRGV